MDYYLLLEDQVIFDLNKYNLKVFIIGSGNVASHLSKALKANGISVSGIFSRNENDGRTIAYKIDTQWYGKLKSIPKDSNIYLICVSDGAIQEIVSQLPKSIKKSKIIAHTSGSISIKESLIECKNGGVFYPLQTFTKDKRISYKSIPFCINGTNKKTIRILAELGNSISESVQTINDNQRKIIHLSAVMINNFVNHLIYVSEDLLLKENVDPEILQPLLLETIQKQINLGPFDAQTGPARRLDAQTLASHLDLLAQNKPYKAMYMAISKSIQKTYKNY